METPNFDDWTELIPILNYFPGMTPASVQVHLEGNFKNAAFHESRTKISESEKMELRKFLLIKGIKQQVNAVIEILEKPNINEFDQLKLSVFFDFLLVKIKRNYLSYLK
ncbi:MAG TPA: hypothetical protein PLQ36_00580 [Candidatus Gracilibacteria bacterium]|nr:hypothetical protein [Candidatus Gracilibacteria bacterium]